MISPQAEIALTGNDFAKMEETALREAARFFDALFDDERGVWVANHGTGMILAIELIRPARATTTTEIRRVGARTVRVEEWEAEFLVSLL